MSTEENNLSHSFDQELEKLKATTILSPEYKRKKTIMWFIRTLIATTVFVYFWDTSWVKWALIVYIPLSILNLIVIYGGTAFLNRKFNRTQNKINSMDDEQ